MNDPIRAWQQRRRRWDRPCLLPDDPDQPPPRPRPAPETLTPGGGPIDDDDDDSPAALFRAYLREARDGVYGA